MPVDSFGATALTRALMRLRWRAFNAPGCPESMICVIRRAPHSLLSPCSVPIAPLIRSFTTIQRSAVPLRTSISHSKCHYIPSLRGTGRSPTSVRSYSTETQQVKFGEMTAEEYKKSAHRFKPLTMQEIVAVFGPGVTRAQGNHLLDTLQKQRVTGTLDYEVEGPGVTKTRIKYALHWLRRKYPLDEDAAIMARIDREEAILNQWQPQQRQQESVLEQRVKQVQEERLRRQKEEIEAMRKDEENNVHLGPKEVARRGTNPTAAARINEKGSGSEWVEKYRERARLSDMKEPPKLSAWQMLGPTTAFALVVLLGAAFFAANYVAPSKNARLFPDTPPAAATILGIIGINVAILLMWRLPPLYRFMNKNFLMIAATPSPLAMLGNVFSHHSAMHLAANMVGLWFLGTALCDEIGRGNFLALYIASGVMGSWLSLVRFFFIGNLTFSSLGASGAVLGVVAGYCTLNPKYRLTIAFLPESWSQYVSFKAEYLLYTLVLFESVTFFRGKIVSVDHGAHLGGLLTGIVGAEALRRRAMAKRKSMQERMRALTDS